MSDSWKVCSTCKKPIPFEAEYYKCSVSTCNRKRLPMFFCSLPCWEAHIPMMRHRDAWAEKAVAPSVTAYQAEQTAENEAAERRVATPPRAQGTRSEVGTGSDLELSDDELPKDILIVVSKLKKYVKARSGFNTSDNAMSILSDRVRAIVDEAIKNAARDDRRTVFDRDVAKVPKVVGTGYRHED